MTEQQLDLSETSAAQDFAIADQLAAALDESDPLAPPGEQEPAPPELNLADALKPAIQITFDLLKPGWNIREEESQALADSYANVIEIFFPSLNVDPRLAAVGMACFTTFAVISPRVKADREKAEKAEAKALTKKTDSSAPIQYDKSPADPLAWNKG